MTSAERELQQLLAIRPLGAQPKYQHPEGRYRIDVFFPEWKLAVEIDGPRHEEQVEYDRTRDAQLASMGIAVLRLSSFLTPEQLRERIRYVSQRILYMGFDAKVKFCLEFSQPKTAQQVDQESTTSESFNASRANPLCLDCNGSGWKMMPWWNERWRRAEMRAKRCDCKNLRQSPQEAPLVLTAEDFEQKKPQQNALLMFPERQKANG